MEAVDRGLKAGALLRILFRASSAYVAGITRNVGDDVWSGPSACFTRISDADDTSTVRKPSPPDGLTNSKKMGSKITAVGRDGPIILPAEKYPESSSFFVHSDPTSAPSILCATLFVVNKPRPPRAQWNSSSVPPARGRWIYASCVAPFFQYLLHQKALPVSDSPMSLGTRPVDAGPLCAAADVGQEQFLTAVENRMVRGPSFLDLWLTPHKA